MKQRWSWLHYIRHIDHTSFPLHTGCLDPLPMQKIWFMTYSFKLTLIPTKFRQVDLIAESFIKASVTGNFEEFIDLLTEDVVLISDGGGKVPAALNPIVNKQRVSAFLKGITAKGSFIGEVLPVIVNGQKGILQVKEGHPDKVICFELDSQQKTIQRIFIIRNPDKLKHIPIP